MTTLDDLVNVYFHASNEACVTTDMRTMNFAEVTMKAGIAAVVRALRDEFLSEWGMWERFDKILGTVAGAGDDAAGGSGQDAVPGSIHHSAMLTGSDAAPAAACCQWDKHSRWEKSGWNYLAHCDGIYRWVPSGRSKICPSCGKPIKFTEVTP